MKQILWIFSLVWFFAGIFLLIAPLQAKKNMLKMKKIPKSILGIIPIVVGSLFLLSSPASEFSWFISILGMLALLKGIFILLSTKSVIKLTFGWWFNQNASMYRLWGIISIILSLLIPASL